MDRRTIAAFLFMIVFPLITGISFSDTVHDDWIKRRHNAYNIGDKDRERRALGPYYYDLSSQQKPFSSSPAPASGTGVTAPPEPDYTSLFSRKSLEPSPAAAALNLTIQGYLLLAKDKRQEALLLFGSAARLEPENIEICLAYGCGLFSTGNFFDSALWFRKAIDLHPDGSSLRYAAAEYFPSKARYRKTLQDLQAWTTEHPEDREELFLLGFLLVLNDQKHEASAVLKKIEPPRDPVIDELLHICRNDS